MESEFEFTAHDQSDWAHLVSLLPPHWEAKSHELKALRRLRGFATPEALLRTLMIHLLDGLSLRETVVRAREGKVADVSDVALLKRLNSCGEWFRWLAVACRENREFEGPPTCSPFRFILVDATHVSEPGATGTDWRIHYAFDLNTLECADLKVTDQKVGETFKNFAIQPGAVYMGDRGYWQNQGLAYLKSRGAHAMVRMGSQARNIFKPDDQSFDLRAKLRKLKGQGIGDWPVKLPLEEGYCEGRICAVRKSKAAIREGEKHVRSVCRKKQRAVSEKALEASRYICIFTTVPAHELPAELVLEAYRRRWQIELCFKRLKSLLGLGHLPKQDPQGAKAWIHGKLFCAMLIERLISYADSFSPWGYALRTR
jgi:hypothetical protein